MKNQIKTLHARMDEIGGSQNRRNSSPSKYASIESGRGSKAVNGRK
jgi:hypothetical protein